MRAQRTLCGVAALAALACGCNLLSGLEQFVIRDVATAGAGGGGGSGGAVAINVLVHPTDAALVGSQVWVANLDGASVSRFAADGSPADPVTPFDTPIGIAVVNSPMGPQVWVASNGGNRIYRRRLDGTSAAMDLKVIQLNHPTGIAAVGSEVWVANTNTVLRFDADGTYRSPVKDPAIDNPRDILVVGNEVWVANAGAHNVLRYDFAGSSAGLPFSGFAAPSGLALVGGRVWVSNANQNTITILDTSGKFIGTRSDSGLHYPWGIVSVTGSARPVWVINQASSSISTLLP